MVEYTKGLHEVADQVWAWLAPDGSWCLSNAGLIRGDGESFLVDTLIDYPMTAEMLAAMAAVTEGSPLTGALNTHANGDHCYGNALLAPEVTIHATAHTGHEMHDVPPALLGRLVESDLGPVLSPYIRHCFSAFHFDGIEVRDPDRTFSGELTLTVGGREVRLVELGPAHTEGDSVAFVPDSGVVFAGDLLFIGGSPISWSGALDRWIAACDRMISWDPAVVVPGHGPVTDVAGIREVRDHLTHVWDATKTAISAGQPWLEAANRIDLGRFAGLPDSERVVVSIYQAYRQLEPSTPETSVVDLFARMAEWRAARS
jgi:glyoxylase-like metal-dependent hydrolase (beta-lactamase superfamily II)